MKKALLCIMLLVFMFSLQAQGAYLITTDDAFIDETQPGTNLGSANYLVIRRTGLTGYRLYGLLRFDLSAIPSGSMINSAVLNLNYYHNNDGNPVGNPMQLHRITQSWSEGTVTWNNRPNYDPMSLASTPMPGSFGWVRWNIRNGVQDYVDGTHTNYGWQLMDFATSDNCMSYFRAEEYTGVSQDPYMEVQYGKIFIDASATGVNNGSNWTDAYTRLQDGLVRAVSGEEIYVAEGTYYPDQGGGQTPGNRAATFQLKNNVKLYGGFPPGGGSMQQRDPNAYQTILSGDIGTVDVKTDNSYHVVTGTGATANVLLDGFTVTRGYANGSYPDDRGAGMYNNPGSPAIVACEFLRNEAASDGGGIYNRESSPDLTDCTFSFNVAYYHGGGIYNYDCDSNLTRCDFTDNTSTEGYGGGIANHFHGNTTLNDCDFYRNVAASGGGISNYENSMTLTDCELIENSATDYAGGAIYNYYCDETTLKRCSFRNNESEMGGAMCNYSYSDPELVQCTFRGNSADYGGAIYNGETSNPVLTNCLFYDNEATNYGGAILNYFDSNPVLTHCTLGANSAGACGGIYNMEMPDCDPAVTNSILWGNTGGSGVSAQIYGCNPVVTYSCIQDADPDDGSIPFGGAANHNIDDDPLFENLSGGDLRLGPDSPCVDAGSNSAVPADTLDIDDDTNTAEPLPLDLQEYERFLDGDCDGNATVNMGTYEMKWIVYGDLDGDCDIDLDDMAILSKHWLAGK